MTQTLGLDFGGTSIKWARLSSAGPQPVLVASGSVPTPRTGTAAVLDVLTHLASRTFDGSRGSEPASGTGTEPASEIATEPA
nr:hypothetical protein [Micromonospora sp. DSM 115978]